MRTLSISFVMASTLATIAALQPARAGSKAENKDEPWMTTLAPWEVECSCGEPRKGTTSQVPAEKCPSGKIKGSFDLAVGTPDDVLKEVAPKKCEKILADAGVCSRVNCVVEATSEPKVELSYWFPKDTFDTKLDSSKLYVQQKDTAFVFDASLEGSTIEFDVQTREYGVKQQLKAGGGGAPGGATMQLGQSKLGESKLTTTEEVGKAQGKLKAPVLFPLAFGYFAREGTAVTKIKGKLTADNYKAFKKLKDASKGKLSAAEVLAQMIGKEAGTTKYWHDHLGARFAKVSKAEEDEASQSVEFEVDVGG
jgi:hypothetical protein